MLCLEVLVASFPSSPSENRAFLSLVAVVQLAVTLVVSIFGEYGSHADASDPMHSYHPVYGGLHHGDNLFYYYIVFATPLKLLVVVYFGVHLGGATSGVPLHLRLIGAAVLAQFSLVLESFSKALAERKWPTIEYEVETIMEAEKSCCGSLVIMTALAFVCRHQAPLRSFTLALIGSFVACANEYILRYIWMASDTGLLFSVQVFAPAFGLTAAYVSQRKLYKYDQMKESPSCDSRITITSSSSTLSESQEDSHVFVQAKWIVFILTWATWPSFVAALGYPGDEPHRAYLNAVVACSASVVTHAFLTSWLLPSTDDWTAKSQSGCAIALDHCIAGVASGAVAVSGVAFNMLEPIGAVLLGGVGGIISAAGALVLAPLWMSAKYSRSSSIVPLTPLTRIYSSHLLPGIASGLAAVFVAAFAEEAGYGFRLYGLYEARSPPSGSLLWHDKAAASGMFDKFPSGIGRSAEVQGLVQLAALVQTVGLALATGGLFGALVDCF